MTGHTGKRSMASVRPFERQNAQFGQAGVATVIKRAAEQGKLEGRNKIQCPELLAILTSFMFVYLISKSFPLFH